MISMDLNEHIFWVHEEMKPFNFNIRDNAGAF